MYEGREESMHTEAIAWAEKMRGRGFVIRYAEGWHHWEYGDSDTDLLPLDGRFTYTTAPRGQKNPNIIGWNKRENCIYKPEDGVLLSGKNIGLVHAYCNPPTMCLDIDDWEGAEEYMEKEMGICSHKHLLCLPISSYRSGRDNSLKVIWTMPKSVGVLPTAVVKAKDGHVLFEYRCGTRTGKSSFDLLPPSLHPSGTNYEWDYEPHNLSTADEIPEYFLEHWQGLLQKGKPTKANASAFSSYSGEETPNKLALLRVMLRHISADCCREDWMKIIFSILSSGYSAAEIIAYDWSITSDRYTEEDFKNLLRDFKSGVVGANGAITLGTVYHHARLGGFNG